MKKGLYIILLLACIGFKFSALAQETGIRSKGSMVWEERSVIFDANDVKYLQQELDQLFRECGRGAENG